MNKSKIIATLCLLAFIGLAMFNPIKNTHVQLSYPKTWPKPNYDFSKNPLTQEGIDLGRKLFYDPILSSDSSISCSNCHLSYTAFTHVDHALSHGVNDSVGTRNSPTLINLAWLTSFMWDGSVNHLDMQALAPITHPAEMNEDINQVIKKLQSTTTYPNMFYKAFGDTKITGEHLFKAISQFELTLVSFNAKYDSVMLKQTKFTAQEESGYNLFKQNCSACHSEPFFTNHQFENNGLMIDSTLNDYGRYNITKNPLDSLKFKVPTLRNIEFSFPYMHDGRFKNLSEVLHHYTKNINQSSSLSQHLTKSIILNSHEKVDLVAFLLTLTDKNFLFNKNNSFPNELFYPPAKE